MRNVICPAAFGIEKLIIVICPAAAFGIGKYRNVKCPATFEIEKLRNVICPAAAFEMIWVHIRAGATPGGVATETKDRSDVN